MSSLVYTDINKIDPEKTYKGYIFSDFLNNQVIEELLGTLCQQLENEIIWFTKEINPHITWQFHNSIQGTDLCKIYQDISKQLSSLHTPTNIFHENTLHKSHLRSSFINQEKHLLLIPHHDNKFYDIVATWLTPHISLGIYNWKLADGQILTILRSIKDNIFAHFKDKKMIHITPDQIAKIKYKEL